MRPKGGSSSDPKAWWGPPEPVLAPKPSQPRNGQNNSGPKICQEPKMVKIQPMASVSHQRPPAQLQEWIPLKFRGRLSLPQCTPHSRIQEWCIYGIIYHYAPFLLRNSMVTFSGPNYVIPDQVPNTSPISKEDLF
ncbi:hypothetical protein O181_081825 [Austropuccinia psidii MF-1]|uniref:Uncharacterized protein n=1 Tax=Austropuccinia psidii MF-1 TaxID=1389203 RepID=A0A9Q3IK97_9BASI|nr:hypothetical protein [Austropuccinia psidii MF-1]